MLRTVVSFILSGVFLVLFMRWFFEQVPEAKPAWQEVKGFLVQVYHQHGLIAAVFVVVAVYVLIQTIGEGR